MKFDSQAFNSAASGAEKAGKGVLQFAGGALATVAGVGTIMADFLNPAKDNQPKEADAGAVLFNKGLDLCKEGAQQIVAGAQEVRAAAPKITSLANS